MILFNLNLNQIRSTTCYHQEAHYHNKTNKRIVVKPVCFGYIMRIKEKEKKVDAIKEDKYFIDQNQKKTQKSLTTFLEIPTWTRGLTGLDPS